MSTRRPFGGDDDGVKQILQREELEYLARLPPYKIPPKPPVDRTPERYRPTPCGGELKPYLQQFMDTPAEQIDFSTIPIRTRFAGHLRAVTGALLPAVAVGDDGALLTCQETMPHEVLRYRGDRLVRYEVAGLEDGIRVVQFLRPNWSVKKPMAQSSLYALEEDGSCLVAVGKLGRIYSSQLAGKWNRCSSPTHNTLRAVHFAPSQNLWVCAGDRVICTSTNRTDWRLATFPNFCNLRAVTYGNGVWLAVGEGGSLVRSLDARTWDTLQPACAVDLQATVYGFGRFFAAGDQGTVLSSPDGLNWSVENSQTLADLRSLCVTPRGIVAVGDTLLFSPEGVAWTTLSGPPAIQLHCVCWTGLKCIAVGSHGSMLDIVPTAFTIHDTFTKS